MFIDISRTIHPDMSIYPGNPLVEFEEIAKVEEGTSALTRLSFGSHTGTHIDAPAHILAGAQGVDMYSLEQLIGEAQVVDLSHLSDVITASDVPEKTATRVIFKTRNSDQDVNVFDPAFVALDESAATKLVLQGVRLVGIDALSIKKKGVQDNVHKIFLDAGVVILEGLWLQGVEAGMYELICLPLSFIDLDGSPVRAVLRS